MNWIWIVGAPLVRAIMAVTFRVRVVGLERVPRRGPAIVAPNHVSILDGPALSAVIGTQVWRPVRNLIAAEVFRGALRWILTQARQIPIRRGTGDSGALDEAIRVIRQGGCAGIFPEGHVSEHAGREGLQRIRSGLTRIAFPTEAPVIPVGIWGTQTTWPRDDLRWRMVLRRPRLVMSFGEPLIPDAANETPAAFRARYQAALDAEVERARSLAT
jgi:1-acyl-sn-glycerol-3-phosphate acyltransferase